MSRANLPIAAALLASLAAWPACGGDDADGGSDAGPADASTSAAEMRLTGRLIGADVPDRAKVLVLWNVDPGGEPYKFAEGTSLGPSYTLSEDADPPAGVVDPSGIAVGYLGLVDSDMVIADGPVDAARYEELVGQLLGGSADAIIWRSPTAEGPRWSEDFDVGYGCGECVPPVEGEPLGTFRRDTCSTVSIEVGADQPLAACPWR